MHAASLQLLISGPTPRSQLLPGILISSYSDFFLGTILSACLDSSTGLHLLQIIVLLLGNRVLEKLLQLVDGTQIPGDTFPRIEVEYFVSFGEIAK